MRKTEIVLLELMAQMEEKDKISSEIKTKLQGTQGTLELNKRKSQNPRE